MSENEGYAVYQPETAATDAAPEAPQAEGEWAEARAGVAPGQEGLESAVVEMLRTCYDPEIPVDIYELGLIYGVGIDADGKVWVDMTLTSPACPVAELLPMEVESRVLAVPGVTDAKVNVTWDPPWTPDRMSEAAKLELGFM